MNFTETDKAAYGEGLIDGIEVMNQDEFYPIAMDRAVERGLFMSANSDIHAATSSEYTSGGNYRVDFDYSDFQDFDGKKFPGDMQLQFKAGTKSMNLTFRIGSLREDDGWDTKTAVSRRYEKVDVEKILKLK